MDTPWHKHYSVGVPVEINAGKFSSIVEMFERACLQHAGNTALTWQQSRLSFDYLGELASHFAAWLQTRGFTKGDRIALVVPNGFQFPIAFFGALKAGCTLVTLNPEEPSESLESKLDNARIKGLVIADDTARRLAEKKPLDDLQQVIITRPNDMFGSLKGKLVEVASRQGHKGQGRLDNHVRFKQTLKEGSRLPFTPVPLDRGDIACLQYTKGKAGSLQGVLLSHGNFLANIAQLKAYIAPVLKSKEPSPGITPLPLSDALALTCNLLLLTHLGINNLLLHKPGNPSALIRELMRQPFSYMTGTNRLYRALVEHPDIRDIDFSALHLSIAGALPIQPEIAQRWQAISGVPLTLGYGLAEASSLVSLMPACPSPPGFSGSVGLPLPSTIVSIRDHQGKAAAHDQLGELCLRGPQLFSGYWQPDRDTAAVHQDTQHWWDDGFFRTGDVAQMNEQGYITLVNSRYPLENDMTVAAEAFPPINITG